MTHLLDTNVVSELRKGPRADPGVREWFETAGDGLYLSVLVIGELRRGTELIRRRDPQAANSLELWLDATISAFADHILPVTQTVAQAWGQMGVPDPVPVIDGLLAATAVVHDLVLVTRNIADVASTGVAVINPFAADR